jgi:putative ABC transport system ATP-binding protein
MDITNQNLITRSNIFSPVFYDQDVGSAGNLTLLENLVIASLHHRQRSIIEPAISSEIREKFTEQLRDIDFMGMEELIDEKVSNISRAHRQVLALLIAVIKGTQVLLIDEHSTGLDATTAAALLEATEKIIKSQKITTIMAVSDPKFALKVSGRTVTLNYGRIVSNLPESDKKNAKPANLPAM